MSRIPTRNRFHFEHRLCQVSRRSITEPARLIGHDSGAWTGSAGPSQGGIGGDDHSILTGQATLQRGFHAQSSWQGFSFGPYHFGMVESRRGIPRGQKTSIGVHTFRGRGLSTLIWQRIRLPRGVMEVSTALEETNLRVGAMPWPSAGLG